MTDESKSLQIAEYSTIDAAMAELKARYAGVIFDVTTKVGMEDAKDVKRRLTKLRTGLEAIRVDIKAPALKRTQAIDAEAKLITSAIRALEDPIALQIKQEEDRIEAEKEAKAQAERERVAGIRAKIEAIRNIPLSMVGATLEVVGEEHEALFDFKADPAVFQEFTEECQKVADDACEALTDMCNRMLDQKKADEALAAERERLAQAEREAAAKLAAERAAMDEERARMQAERAAFAAERAAFEASKVVPVVEVALIEEVATTQEEDEAFDAIAAAPTKPIEAVIPTYNFQVRRLANATADQFHALAGKCYAVGASAFATSLQTVSDALREGQYDSALAGADFELMVSFDNALLDATMACIDALSAEEMAA